MKAVIGYWLYLSFSILSIILQLGISDVGRQRVNIGIVFTQL
jgi:hypothetical protein